VSVGRETPSVARIEEVIVVIATRGLGEENDPVRTVTQYWSRNGVLLAEYDPKYPSPPFTIAMI